MIDGQLDLSSPSGYMANWTCPPAPGCPPSGPAWLQTRCVFLPPSFKSIVMAPSMQKGNPFGFPFRLAANWTLAFASRKSGSDRLRCKPSTGGFALRSVSSPVPEPEQQKRPNLSIEPFPLRPTGLEPAQDFSH